MRSLRLVAVVVALVLALVACGGGGGGDDDDASASPTTAAPTSTTTTEPEEPEPAWYEGSYVLFAEYDECSFNGGSVDSQLLVIDGDEVTITQAEHGFVGTVEDVGTDEVRLELDSTFIADPELPPAHLTMILRRAGDGAIDGTTSFGGIHLSGETGFMCADRRFDGVVASSPADASCDQVDITQAVVIGEGSTTVRVDEVQCVDGWAVADGVDLPGDAPRSWLLHAQGTGWTLLDPYSICHSGIDVLPADLELDCDAVVTTTTTAPSAPIPSPSPPPVTTPPAPPALDGDLPPFHQDRASGSGCAPGGDALGTGWWYGSIEGPPTATVAFDLACYYIGDIAHQMAREAGEEMAYNDYWIVNDNPKIRQVPVSPSASAACIHDDYVATPCTPADIDGTIWGVWIRTNGGVVDRIVEQFAP